MAEHSARMPLWARVALPLLVLAVALVLGSGALDSAPPSASERAVAIESVVRCPSCTDLSVAQSNATTAIAVRHQIEHMVAAGSSAADIEQTLVSEYGQSILLVPPDTGGIPLIWVLPLVLGVGALAGVGVVFWRRSRAFDALKAPAGAAGAAPERPPGPAHGNEEHAAGGAGAVTVEGTTERRGLAREADTEDERWHLSDERDFLQRSIEDADREHAAGDLSDEDHALLVARDSVRLTEVVAELAALGPAPSSAAAPTQGDRGPSGSEGGADGADVAQPPRPSMPLWRKAGIAAACLLIALGIGILVAQFVQSRAPGQASSGSVTLSQAQSIEEQLQQALALNNEGDTKGALELYDKVLSEDPSNPAALSYAGYLQWNVGSSAHVPSLVRVGRSMIETAVRNSPSYYEAHLFYGLVLENQDHDHRAAVAQFEQFLADGPPAGEPAQVASLVAGAYRAAGAPLPAAFSGTSTSTTTPGSGVAGGPGSSAP